MSLLRKILVSPYLLLLCVLWYCPSLTAQDTTELEIIECYSIIIEDIDLGPVEYPPYLVTGSVLRIEEKNFNSGLINDPLMLLQGRVAGTQIYNRGGDPNQSAMARIRGLSSLGADQLPLIVIDGVANVSLENLDPNDVAQVTFLKDASAAALYGIRAINGVIIIKTKTATNAQLPLQLSYSGQLASAFAYPGIELMSASEFVSQGGIDLGSVTNWQDEVTQAGISNSHNIVLSGRKENTTYRLSNNFRLQNGVLKNSGFNSWNSRLNVSSSLLKDKLNVQLGGSFTAAKRRLGFEEANRYATIFNPTAPVDGANAILPFNAEQYGGYFETIGLFDSHNPVSIVEQNTNNRKDQFLNLNAKVGYELMENWTVNVSFGHQDLFSNTRAFYPITSYFRGGANSPLVENRGAAMLTDYDNTTNNLDIFSIYKLDFDNIDFQFTLGYAQQSESLNFESFALTGYDDASVLDINRLSSLNTGTAQGVDRDARFWESNISGFFAHALMDINRQFFAQASLRREGSSRLAEKNQYGLFPSLGLGWDVGRSINGIEQLKFRAGYGLTGGIPFEAGWSKDFYRAIILPDGTRENVLVRPGNPDLDYEKQSEINVGADFKWKWLSGSLDFFTRKNTDLILLSYLESAADLVYDNTNEFTTNGVDVFINAQIHNSAKLSFNTGVIFSTSKTIVNKHVDEVAMVGNPGAPGHGSTAMIRIKNGEAFGELWGPVFAGAQENGDVQFEDLNGDGEVNSDMTFALEPNGDFTTLGNALPNFELGWTNQLKVGDWKLNAFFRGAFGHSLINSLRLFYEREPFDNANGVYNRVNTELAEPGFSSSRYGSHVVEKASFFKLDNLSLIRSFELGKASRPLGLDLSLTAQNLFTLTQYTGADPEPVLASLQSVSNADTRRSNSPNPLEPGIDRRNFYLPSKTISLGIRLQF